MARTIPIATLAPSTPSTVRKILSSIPILEKKGDEDWNSQNWVWDALEGLVEAGCLDARAKDRGLEEMVDVVMEAGDEKVLLEI